MEITAKAFKARQGYERWMTQLQILQYQDYISQLNATQLSATSTITDVQADDGTCRVPPAASSLGQLAAELTDPDLASAYAGQVLDAMIEEELARQEAATRGLTVADDDIQLRTERFSVTIATLRRAIADTTTRPTQPPSRNPRRRRPNPR